MRIVELEGERVDMPEVVERKFKGDKVKLDIWRDKQPMTVTIELGTPSGRIRIQGHSYDVQPRYVALRRLLFQPLTLDLLEAYQPTDLRLRHFFDLLCPGTTLSGTSGRDRADQYSAGPDQYLSGSHIAAGLSMK